MTLRLTSDQAFDANSAVVMLSFYYRSSPPSTPIKSQVSLRLASDEAFDADCVIVILSFYSADPLLPALL